MNKINEILRHPFRDFLVLDLRALGLFRISLGLCLIIDFLDRLKDVEVFYSSQGMVYPSLFSGNVFSNNTFSLNFLSGDASFQTTLLILGLIFSILFTIGYFTKISTIVLWILIVSVQNLNGLILQGGDDYIRLLMFWAMFLPLGRRLSIDSLHLTFPSGNRYFSVANLGLIFQIAFLYFFTAALKDSPIWTTDFTAVYYALSLDAFRTPIGDIILNIRWLPPILSFFAIFIEKLVPILILMPVFNQYTRILAFILIVNLHVGIGIGMDVGPFSWVTIAAAVSLIHTQWIDLAISILKKKLKDTDKLKLKQWRERIMGILNEIPYYNFQIVKRDYTKRLFNTVGVVVSAVVIIGLLTLVFVTNINTLGYRYSVGEIPSKINRFLRIDQSWKMFAPYPSFEDGWTVILGRDEYGTQYNLFQGNTLDKKPEALYKNPKNERWKKYTMNLWGEERYRTERIYLLGYYCRKSQVGELDGVPPLVSLDFYHVLELSQPDYQPTTTTPKLLTNIECSR
jgi:hypothetical protein